MLYRLKINEINKKKTIEKKQTIISTEIVLEWVILTPVTDLKGVANGEGLQDQGYFNYSERNYG